MDKTSCKPNRKHCFCQGPDIIRCHSNSEWLLLFHQSCHRWLYLQSLLPYLDPLLESYSRNTSLTLLLRVALPGSPGVSQPRFLYQVSKSNLVWRQAVMVVMGWCDLNHARSVSLDLNSTGTISLTLCGLNTILGRIRGELGVSMYPAASLRSSTNKSYFIFTLCDIPDMFVSRSHSMVSPLFSGKSWSSKSVKVAQSCPTLCNPMD